MTNPDDDENPYAFPFSEPPPAPAEGEAEPPLRLPPPPALPADPGPAPYSPPTRAVVPQPAAPPPAGDPGLGPKKWMIIGGAAAVVLIGGGLSLAMCGGGDKNAATTPTRDAAVAVVAPVAPPPTQAPTTNDDRPIGTRACEEGQYSCSDDGKEILQCKAGRLLVTYRMCRGPLGCFMKDKKPVCDQSVAEAGDTCWNQGHYACSYDSLSQFLCSGGTFVRMRSCSVKHCALKTPTQTICE